MLPPPSSRRRCRHTTAAGLSLPPRCRRQRLHFYHCSHCARRWAIALPLLDAPATLFPLLLTRCPPLLPNCHASRCHPAATPLPPPSPRRHHHCGASAATAALLPPPPPCCQQGRCHQANNAAAAALLLPPRCHHRCPATVAFVFVIVIVSAAKAATLPPRSR